MSSETGTTTSSGTGTTTSSGTGTTTSSGTDVLEQFYAAINRNDLDAVEAHFDPEIERVEPGGSPTAGTYRGIAAVRAHVAAGRGSWAEGTCEPERFLANGERIVAFAHVRVRLKESAEWIDARFADGFVLRHGRIVRFLTFARRSEALEWAGIDPPTPSLTSASRSP